MKATEAIKFYGSTQNLCQAIGAKYSRVKNWENRDGDRVPLRIALKLQQMTRGKLRVNLEMYE